MTVFNHLKNITYITLGDFNMNERVSTKVVVDAGHGGTDGGATANGILEKEYTLKISKYINNRLKELGIDSSLTRDGDVTLEPNDRVKKALSLYGSGSDVILLSNHINAGGLLCSCLGTRLNLRQAS